MILYEIVLERPNRQRFPLLFRMRAPSVPPAAAYRAPLDQIIMSLTLDDVQRIAHLARIDVTSDEVVAVHAKLQSIFGLIDELQAIDTEGVTPMAHAQDATLPLRDDIVTEADRHELYQQPAPATEDGLYLVPRVVE